MKKALICLLAVCFFVCWRALSRPSDVSQLPLFVSCGVQGLFSSGEAWTLEVSPDGAAHLWVDGYPKLKERRFKISSAQFAELRSVMEKERFFDLGEEYGDSVPDGSTRTLSIKRGDAGKTVILRYLRREDPKLQEIRRALRVWNTVRKWFDDKDAVDFRQYDERRLQP